LRRSRKPFNSFLCQLQRSLDANDAEVSWRHRDKDVENCRCEWSQDGHGVAWGADQNDAQLTAAKVLLEAEVLVHRDQRVVLGFSRIEQRAVIEIGPAASMDRVDAMPGQASTEGSRNIPVEEDAYAAIRPRA
jgi:hypothetical protein